MNNHVVRARAASRNVAMALALIGAPVWCLGLANASPPPSPGDNVVAQVVAPQSAPAPASGGAGTPVTTASTQSWTFATGAADRPTWTAERGRMTVANGEATLQPDANRRVVLLSPPALPDTMRSAETFTLGIIGTGVQRVRIAARRDPRGGWITIADASGKALRETPDGYVIKRKTGSRSAGIEQLRIEIDFRTSNPRVLRLISVQ